MDGSHQQLFASFLRPRLEAELQQQTVTYSQQIAAALAYDTHCIIAAQIDAFLQKFQSIPRSPSPPPHHAAQNMTPKAETGASRCRRYLLLPVQPLSQKTTYVFLGNVLSNLRSTPGAIFQQALSSPDLIELLRRQHGIPSTYLPLGDVAVCPIVDKMRNFGRTHRVGRAFEKMIRVAVKTFSHLFKDTGFGKLIERLVARFMLGLILERECANFGATPISVDRARLYIVRLRGLTRYLDKICCSEEGMAQIINNLRTPTVFDVKGSGALIRQNNMSIVSYAARSGSPVASPRTLAASAFVPQIAERKLATRKQTSTTSKFRSDTAPNLRMSVPAISSMNMLQHTTPVQPAQIVPRVHTMSSQAQPIVTQATHFVDATTHNVDTNGSLAILGAIPQSDAMEDCIPERTHSQQVVITDSHARLPQAMDGVQTSSDSSHGTKIGQDEMDDIQSTSQPTVAAPASDLVQNENQNMPDALPPPKITLRSTIQSNVAPSSTDPVETKDKDMLDASPPAHSTLRPAIRPNLAPPTTVPVDTKDQDMTDAPPPAQPPLASSRSVSGAHAVTAISSITPFERPMSRPPLDPTAFRPSFSQPLVTSSLSGLNGTESTIESRARAMARANPYNHWANGKAHNLLMQVPELHHALQQALPRTNDTGQRDQFRRGEILEYIHNATSAAELAKNIDHAMRNQLLTNAEFNKLSRYAHDWQYARGREARENVGRLNMGNSPTKHQIGFSQTAANSTAQPANLAAPLHSSGVTTNGNAQAANLVAPRRTANANDNGAGLPPTRPVEEEPETSEPESSEKKLTKLLIEARRKMMIRNDPVSTLFASIFDISWHASDIDIMAEYLINRPPFKYCDSNRPGKVDIKTTIEKMQALVEENTASSCEEIVWMCKEALNAQDVKAEDETLHRFANCEIRQKWLGALFERISAVNLKLIKEVHPNGCLTWDEMKDLARTEELGCFTKSVNTKQLPPYQWMREKVAFWSDRKNMKKLIVDRIAAQNMTTDQATAPLSTGSPKAKRNITDISDDHDKVSKEVDVDATDDGKTHVPEAKEPALKRFRDAPTQQQERAAMKDKATRRADDSGRSDQMKRSRD